MSDQEVKPSEAETIIETPKPVEADTYHNPEALIRISIWANWIAWLFLASAVLNFGLRIYQNYYPYFSQGAADAQTIINIVVNESYSLIFMGFVFLVLQGVSHGINILLDIYEKLQGK
ncbi:MAG: hypothetical protein HGA82_03605 [Anaerolineales bacterium]|nr:hypothetical protein [Anaerolineales bacterium]